MAKPKHKTGTLVLLECVNCSEAFEYVARSQACPPKLCSPECRQEWTKKYNRAYSAAAAAKRPVRVLPTPLTRCRVDGCDRPLRSRSSDLCHTHYCRQWRYGTLGLTQNHQPAIGHSSGYVLTWVESHPLATQGKSHYVYEHRRVFYDANGDGPFRCYVCGAVVEWSTWTSTIWTTTRRTTRFRTLSRPARLAIWLEGDTRWSRSGKPKVGC